MNRNRNWLTLSAILLAALTLAIACGGDDDDDAAGDDDDGYGLGDDDMLGGDDDVLGGDAGTNVDDARRAYATADTAAGLAFIGKLAANGISGMGDDTAGGAVRGFRQTDTGGDTGDTGGDTGGDAAGDASDAGAAAAAAAAEIGAAYAACSSTAQEGMGASVTFTCDEDSGVPVILTGTIKIEVEVQMDKSLPPVITGYVITISGEELKLNDREIEGKTTITLTMDPLAATIAFGVQVIESAIGNLSLTGDAAVALDDAACVDFDGVVTAAVEDAGELTVTVTAYKYCEGECPGDGGSISAAVSAEKGDGSVKVSFDGSHTAGVETGSGKTATLPLACGSLL